MPSFNHDNNACWGIRRASYSIFNDPIAFDISVNKTEVSTATAVNQTVSVNETDSYRTSANGYYGYHSQTNTNSTDCAMDTSNDGAFVIAGHTERDVSSDQNLNNNEFLRRKRTHQEDQKKSFKRVKNEGSVINVDVVPAEVQDNSRPALNDTNDLPVYDLYRYLEAFDEDTQVLDKNNKREDEMEFLENYLKQTHGCDFYNLNKSDDF